MTTTPARVSVTPEALAVVRRLEARHGPVMFHQSGGCCDGSSPMCYPAGEFLVGGQDVLLGVLGPDDDGGGEVPVWMGAAQFGYWEHTHLTIDVVPGRGGGFSLEAPEGVRFLVRSRIFSDEEYHLLAAAGPPPRGA